MRSDDIIQVAEGQMGSPYVYGTWGQTCTKALRVRYANYRPDQKAITYARCQQLRDRNVKSSCDGCKYQGLLAFDCRGFVHWCLLKGGIDIYGQSVGTQWNTKSNWDEKGDIAAMPSDLVCCVFVRKTNGNWKHTGLHVGGGRIIHCSVEVKEDTAVGGANKWTHYAIPKGLYSAEEIKAAHHGGIMMLIKKGSQGADVLQLQEWLNEFGYNCGAADGIYGSNTEAAVKAFQAIHALKADGICGPQTWQKLLEQLEPEVDPEPDEPEADPSSVTPDADPDSAECGVRSAELIAMMKRLEDLKTGIDDAIAQLQSWMDDQC